MNSRWVAYDDVSLTLAAATNTYDLAYDEENRLETVEKNDNLLATFGYDADGNRVKSILDGAPDDTITVYIGNYFEWETVEANTTPRSYYYAGSLRVIMKVNGVKSYLLGDHLGSTSITTNSAGRKRAN